MKRLMMAGVVVLGFGCAGLSLAQTAQVTKTPKGSVPVNSNVRQVATKMRSTLKLIQKDKESGKISAAQAKTYADQVHAVRKQEIEDIKASGNKSLTDAQVTQLDGQLDSIASSL